MAKLLLSLLRGHLGGTHTVNLATQQLSRCLKADSGFITLKSSLGGKTQRGTQWVGAPVSPSSDSNGLKFT